MIILKVENKFIEVTDVDGNIVNDNFSLRLDNRYLTNKLNKLNAKIDDLVVLDSDVNEKINLILAKAISRFFKPKLDSTILTKYLTNRNVYNVKINKVYKRLMFILNEYIELDPYPVSNILANHATELVLGNGLPELEVYKDILTDDEIGNNYKLILELTLQVLNEITIDTED